MKHEYNAPEVVTTQLNRTDRRYIRRQMSDKRRILMPRIYNGTPLEAVAFGGRRTVNLIGNKRHV